MQSEKPRREKDETVVVSSPSPVPSPQLPSPSTQPPSAERRQLTVMFCDLVGSTALSAQLDPEEYREVVQGYQDVCATVISRYEGHLAQYLGDGVLAYFGYPVAHEDDAARAVRAGLEIVAGLQSRTRQQAAGVPLPHGRGSEIHLLRVRIGIHTGPVVVGEIGSGIKRELLALGETPNIAARVQSEAAPNTVLMSAATHRLVEGLFTCRNLGSQTLSGLSTSFALYQVEGASKARNRFEVEATVGLTPLTGRDEELALLWRHWEQAKEGEGQVVLLNGEPGIGKSRLLREFRERVLAEHATPLEFHCSPYHQNSAFYPIVEHLQGALQWQKEDTVQDKLDKLGSMLAGYRFPQPDTLSLLAALLSLPHPEDSPPFNLSPQRQKQKTQEALIAWFLEEAGHNAVCCSWEDLHWIDPSTLEFLQLLTEQVPTSRLYILFTFRPEFTSPWGARSHLIHITLNRLGRNQVSRMVEEVTGGKKLPEEIVRQIIAKTDGVPLFVEELTKAVLESGLDGGAQRSAPLPIAIPTTLQDSLMARLDRMNTAKEVAQLGAVIGREFSYELIHAVSSLKGEALQKSLNRLVKAELIYQRGLLPQARYIFKHALIQDTAYQSLLKNTRQQYHQQIAQVLAEQFPEIREMQPELLAHHYTEGGFTAQALPYWQQAGERAIQRSAYVEAINHLTKGLEVLNALPDAPQHANQELTLQLALRDALVVVNGYTAPQVEKTVLRTRELCQQLGETPQLFPVLFRLWVFYINRGEFQTTRELAEQMMRLAQSMQDQYRLSLAHMALGWTSYWIGELASARLHVEQAITLYDPQTHPRPTVNTADPRVDCLSCLAWTLWCLGYPDQALKRSQEALTLAADLSHSFSLAYALGLSAWFHSARREGQLARERAEAVITLSTEQGFPYWLAYGTIVRGGTLAEQGQVEEGIAQMQQGLVTFRAIGTETERSGHFPGLVEAYRKAGQTEEGLTLLVAALAFVDKAGERISKAELYRLKGELLLQAAKD